MITRNDMFKFNVTHDHQFAAQDGYVAALMCGEVVDSSFMEQVESIISGLNFTLSSSANSPISKEEKAIENGKLKGDGLSQVISFSLCMAQ